MSELWRKHGAGGDLPACRSHHRRNGRLYRRIHRRPPGRIKSRRLARRHRRGRHRLRRRRHPWQQGWKAGRRELPAALLLPRLRQGHQCLITRESTNRSQIHHWIVGSFFSFSMWCQQPSLGHAPKAGRGVSGEQKYVLLF